MKIGIYVCAARQKDQYPAKTFEYRQRFQSHLGFAPSDRHAGRATAYVGGCCQGAGKTKGGQNNCRSSAAFPGHARSGRYPAAHASVRWVPFEICETLGSTRAVYGWLKGRLQEVTERHPTLPVMLVVHGTTHYTEPAEQLERIAAALRSDLGREVFATNHLGEPHYQAISGEHPYIVQRLFLQMGILQENRCLVRK
jgi:hypothetical protein